MSPPLILHYHGVCDLPRKWDRHNLMIHPDHLRDQLRSVVRLGYRFVPLAELVASLHRGPRMSNVCALTFDDGSVDNVTVLPEILADFDAPATVYACPALLGSPHPFLAPEASVRLLNADELRALSLTEGFEIGSHTLLHTRLEYADRDQALREMSAAKMALEDLVLQPVTTFSYPGCVYSPACPDAAREAGYQSAVTCARRGSWNPYELRRTSPDRLDSGLTFWLKARQVYDPLWLSPPGRAARRLMRTARHPPLDD